MQELLTRFAKLIDVKSLVTIALTVAFVVMALSGSMDKDFMTIYTVVIAFYFGTQAQKRADGDV